MARVLSLFEQWEGCFYLTAQEFTKYLNFLGYEDFIPDDDYTIKRTVFIPYLFTDKELSSLFFTIDSYTGATCGKRYLPEVVLPVYTRLLYCCGLRPQEPPAILADDVDLETGDVYIRQSKRHKDRHIIMSEDMLRLCRRYDSVAGKRNWFFQKWDGTPYETSWYNNVWRRVISRSGITWRGKPRPYDLRHAFASRNIIRWIDSGRDVMVTAIPVGIHGSPELTSTRTMYTFSRETRNSKGLTGHAVHIYGEGYGR